MTIGITELPPEGMQLAGVALAGDTDRGTRTTEGLSLLFTTAGITVQGPQPQIERLLVWSGLDSASCHEKMALPDGRNAAVMELTSGGQSIRFLLPTDTVSPGQAAYLDQALPAWLARLPGSGRRPHDGCRREPSRRRAGRCRAGRCRAGRSHHHHRPFRAGSCLAVGKPCRVRLGHHREAQRLGGCPGHDVDGGIAASLRPRPAPAPNSSSSSSPGPGGVPGGGCAAAPGQPAHDGGLGPAAPDTATAAGRVPPARRPSRPAFHARDR